jgi:hypothetical protein
MEIGDWAEKINKTSKRYTKRAFKGKIVDRAPYTTQVTVEWTMVILRKNGESIGTPKPLVHKRQTVENEYLLRPTTLTQPEFEIAFKLGALKG